jgi:hypothetical protein
MRVSLLNVSPDLTAISNIEPQRERSVAELFLQIGNVRQSAGGISPVTALQKSRSK